MLENGGQTGHESQACPDFLYLFKFFFFGSRLCIIFDFRLLA